VAFLAAAFFAGGLFSAAAWRTNFFTAGTAALLSRSVLVAVFLTATLLVAFFATAFFAVVAAAFATVLAFGVISLNCGVLDFNSALEYSGAKRWWRARTQAAVICCSIAPKILWPLASSISMRIRSPKRMNGVLAAP
jgi:hypothetical protein